MTTPRRAAVALLGSGALLALAGACSALLPAPDLKPPQIAFSDLVLDEVGRDRVRFTVTIEASNPNAVDMPLSDVHFDLAVLGQPLASGRVAEQRFTLPANGARSLPVVFEVAASDLRRLLVRLLGGPRPEVVWELAGTARWGAAGVPIPFRRRGDASGLRGRGPTT